MTPGPGAGTPDDVDVLVVGGGPAGLSAALYLVRYERRVALFDLGRGRSTWHQANHNYLGSPAASRRGACVSWAASS